MTKFKIGDRVRIIAHSDYGRIGDLLTVDENDSSCPWCIPDIVRNSNATRPAFDENIIELINNKNKKTNNMNIIEKFKLSIKKEPNKTFIQAGVMTTDETFTSDGKELFLTYLLEKFGADFKKDVVDAIIEADKEDNK